MTPGKGAFAVSDEFKEHIRAREADNGVVVIEVLSKELRHPTPALGFGEQLYYLVENEGHNRFVIDFQRTRYMCSTAYAVVFNMAKKVEAANGKLVLCGLHDELLMGANIIHLDELVEIYPDERTALAAFEKT
jgi:anti-anti-sigma factor